MLVLDGSVSPYLPTREILEALSSPTLLEYGAPELARMLRERLALLHGIDPERIALFPNDSTRFDPLLSVNPGHPLVWFAPATHSFDRYGKSIDLVRIERGDRFRIEGAQIEQVPHGSIALVMTPNDPTGNAIALTTAAQLARRARLLILDERSAEMQRRSMIPLVEEFDSIVLMRSFADWAGLALDAPAYAITTRAIAAELDRSDALSIPGLRGALAAVSDASRLDAIAHRVRLERLRLYRMLRKLNFLAPYPSDAGYVLAQVMRGDRDEIAQGLLEREIAVYAPALAGLEETLRFSAISPAATRRLQRALVDVSQTMLG